ncbi:alpha/beta hydrolase [Mesorhizobium sp. CAU 1741]|uniref:alpha/beta fold hydrolase n=1 Tax=Mesorhizobium sp. CAU 1741 TaxID=3140366 RepID=UPI00325B9D92
MVSRRNGLLAPIPDPEKLPVWLFEADLDIDENAFTKTGFRCLNYYRNLDRNWQLQASLSGVKVEVPALFIAGQRDIGLQMPGMTEIIEAMPSVAPRVQEPIVISGGGHSLPQECPDQVSAAIVAFARSTLAAP